MIKEAKVSSIVHEFVKAGQLACQVTDHIKTKFEKSDLMAVSLLIISFELFDEFRISEQQIDNVILNIRNLYKHNDRTKN